MKTSAAHAKMTTETMKGMTDQANSRGIDPWMRAPTDSGSCGRYQTANTMTTTVTSRLKNAARATMKKYRLSTRKTFMNTTPYRPQDESCWKQKSKSSSILLAYRQSLRSSLCRRRGGEVNQHLRRFISTRALDPRPSS